MHPRLIVTANLLAAGAVACGASMPGPDPVRQPDAAYVEVPFPPPPARVEFVPESPRGDAVWIDGEWGWRGRRWGWTYGRWVVMPPAARFMSWSTLRRRDGTLLFAPGTFRDAAGREVAAPASLAIGRARAEQLVDPEGRPERTAPNTQPTSSAPVTAPDEPR